jgi:tetratricopeptide (TPR) repeat protein
MRAAAIVPLLVRFQRHASLGSRRGLALTECGELERAGTFIESALALNPNNAWAWARYELARAVSRGPVAARSIRASPRPQSA